MATELKTEVAGNIKIGKAEIPAKTLLPPKSPGDFEFSYEASDLDTATKIPVGQMVKWAADNIGSTTKVGELPESLRNLNVAVEKLKFDTLGDLDIKVQVGKEDAKKHWDANWKPISGLAFQLSDVTLEFDRTVKPDPQAKR